MAESAMPSLSLNSFASLKRGLPDVGLADEYLAGGDPLAVLYLGKFVTKSGFRIAGISILSRSEIEAQKGGGPPALVQCGILQIAFSDYAERYLLDVSQGHIMQFASNHLSALLSSFEKQNVAENNWPAKLKSEAEYVFQDLLEMFWCFEDLEANPAN